MTKKKTQKKCEYLVKGPLGRIKWPISLAPGHVSMIYALYNQAKTDLETQGGLLLLFLFCGETRRPSHMRTNMDLTYLSILGHVWHDIS